MQKSKSLAEIQSELHHAVKTSTIPESLANIIAEVPPISTKKRLQIYQDAYYLRMTESLNEDFGRVLKEIGDEKFIELSLEFIKKYPSKYPDLGQMSQHFPEFLLEKSARLFELASLDWLEICSSRAARPEEGHILSPSEMESGVVFLLRTYPATLPLQIKNKYYLASRRQNDVEVRAIEKNDHELLSYLTEPRELEAVSAKAEELGFSAEDLQKNFFEWIKNEIIYCERRNNVAKV